MHHPNLAPQPESRQIRTLLVEPDNDARQVIELELSVRGQSVAGCAAAQAALTLFHDNVFHLMVVSRQLPDDDAAQLCRAVRAAPGGDEITLVVVSNAPSEADRAAMIEAGADDYIGRSANDTTLGNRFADVERAARNRTQPGRISDQGSAERFLVLNPNGTIRVAAPVAERLLGFPPEALVGVNAFSFFHPDDAPQLLSIVTEAFVEPRQTRAVEVRVRRDGDSWRTIAVSATNHVSDPRLQGIVFDLRGPDVRVSAGDQVTRAAMHDRVTDLPNRGLFIDRVDHAVARATRRQQAVVVMAVEFGNDAASNGQPGAGTSDGLAIAVAQRLRSCLRTSDTAARVGHDQFGLLLEEVVPPDNVEIVANRIVHAMTLPFFDAGTELTLTPHIGIAVSSPARNRAVDLLRDASIARAWARVQGSGSYVTFDPSMQPPDGEPITSEFNTRPDATAGPSAPAIDDRLDELNQRLASLEQTLARLVPSIK